MRRALFWLSDEQWKRIEPHLPTDVRGVERANDRAPIGLRRDIWHDAFVFDLTTDRVAVVTLVAMEDGCVRHLLQQQFSGSAVGDLTAGDHQGNGATLAVSQGMDLGGASTARAPNRLITLP